MACCEQLPCATYTAHLCNCLPVLHKQRHRVFAILFVIQLLAIIPASIAILGVAKGRQLTIGGWAYERINGKNGFPDSHIYVGLNGLYTRGSAFGREFMTWTEAKKAVPSSKKDNLNRCKHAAKDEISTAIIGLVAILPALGTIYIRSKPETDSGCNKFAGILAGVTGCIVTLNSLSTFVDKCYETLPTKFEVDGVVIGEGEKYIGPGLNCEVIVATVSFIVGVIHSLVPVPADKDPLLDKPDGSAANTL